MGRTHSQLKSILNFRDVGEAINEALGSKRLKPGLLYRGARPDEASFQDRQRLVKDYKVESIIDLRTKTEHIEQAQKRDGKTKNSAMTPQSNEDVAEPPKIPGIQYHEINFNGSAFSRMLMSHLSWIEFFWLVWLMILGYRLDAIKILAPTMESMGLVGISTNSLDTCVKEVKQFFEVLADEKNWPILVHCTQGKDRTGLTIMLVLFLLGIEVGAIEKDYLMSEAELEPEKEERIREIASIGLSEHFAMCPPELVGKVHDHIERKYGGVERYLDSVGVNRRMRDAVARILLEK